MELDKKSNDNFLFTAKDMKRNMVWKNCMLNGTNGYFYD